MGDEQQLRVNEGLLVWDGRVLELFRSDGRADPWRIHIGVIRRCEIEERKQGLVLLTVWDAERHYESATFQVGQLDAVRSIVNEIEAAIASA